MQYKRKLIFILIGIVVMLLVLNVGLGFLHVSAPQSLNSLSQKKIEKKFKKVLSEYGIENNWIRKGKIQKGKSDSLKNSFIVHIPSDIPIAQIIKDINIEFAHQPVVISSSEEQINGLTILMIESGKITKLIADFKKDNEISRKYSSIGILVYNVEDLSEDEINNLLKNPFHFGIVLPLESNSEKIAQIILDSKKEYFIQLSDNTDDENFELNSDLKVDEIKKNVNNIISSFNSPKYFFMDANISGISKSIQEIIKRGFEDRGRKVLNSNEFISLHGENQKDLKSLLKFYLNKLKPNQTEIYRINVENWLAIQSELSEFLKKGNKIIFPPKLF